MSAFYPSLCLNTLKIEGPPARVRAFAARVSTIPAPVSSRRFPICTDQRSLFPRFTVRSPLWLNALVPVPPSVIDAGPARYETWCRRHLGTLRIEQHGVTLEREPGMLRYRFESHLSPVTPWVKRASRLFPELTFELRYLQRHDGHLGIALYKGGRPIHDSGPGTLTHVA